MSEATKIGVRTAQPVDWMSIARRYGAWLLLAAAFAVLPKIFASGIAHTMMSLMGIMIVFALSYNMLLGETGLLSFGHAVYYGLGGFLAAHAMNTLAREALPVPVFLIPLVGGFSGLLFGIVFGSVSTRRGGTAFAMISLGLGELVASSSLILRSFFGGEEGISTNRTKLFRVFDLNFGPQLQVYYLIAAWCLICMIAMYALTRTPFGRMCNAVRDNPERAQFVGYNPYVVRFIAFSLAGLFAGIAGGLAAINFELVNASVVGAGQSLGAWDPREPVRLKRWPNFAALPHRQVHLKMAAILTDGDAQSQALAAACEVAAGDAADFLNACAEIGILEARAAPANGAELSKTAKDAWRNVVGSLKRERAE